MKSVGLQWLSQKLNLILNNLIIDSNFEIEQFENILKSLIEVFSSYKTIDNFQKQDIIDIQYVLTNIGNAISLLLSMPDSDINDLNKKEEIKEYMNSVFKGSC